MEFDNFAVHGRATRGQIIYNPEDRTGELVGAISVSDSDEVVVITSQGKTLKMSVDSVSIQGKSAKGVRILNIDRPDFVVGLDRLVAEDVAEDLVHAAARIESPELPNESDEITEQELSSEDKELGDTTDEDDGRE